MLRQLLTLLAVFSGFTLAAEPVSAAEVRAVSVSAAQAGEDCAGAVAMPMQLAIAVVRQRNGGSLQCAHPAAAYTVLTVQLQVDRARE